MLNTIIKITAAAALAGLMTGCAATATELDFGNSVRANNAAATLHPEGQDSGAEAGNGKRLEHVVTDYHETSSERGEVSSDVRLGVQGSGL